MKKKYLIIIISIVLIISGLISFFIISFQNDKKETIKRMSQVEKNYTKFLSEATKFDDTREDIYNTIFNDTYYDAIIENDSTYKTKFSNYELLVDSIKKETNKLKELCTNVYYPDSTINSKCSAYTLTYEEINNYFVTDTILYNDYITKSNSYAESSKLLNYNTKKKYIDFNKDNKYLGKEAKENE